MVITLRKLKIKDAVYMLEWMHDKNVVEYLQANFQEKNLEDCIRFIDESSLDTNNVHYAIIDEFDTYMGTVSLKHIKDSSAEFAIAIRKIAMGKGISRIAMSQIIDYGLNYLNLSAIYWCVSPMNERALNFCNKNLYETCSFQSIGIENNFYTNEQKNKYSWYCVRK